MGWLNVTGQRALSRIMRVGLPLGVTALALWLLARQIAGVDVRAITGTMWQVSAGQILGALGLTALSFAAIGRYDLVAHRHFQSGIDDKSASRSGIAAVALAQTLGFGLLTGALVRWRMLPDLSLTTAMRLSGFVCLSFLGALALVTAAACLILPAPKGALLPALGLLIALPLMIWLLLCYPILRFGPFTCRMPSLTAVSAILFWVALDTTAAAAAFYLLLPASGPDFGTLLPVFLIAFGAALLSGAPGGVGPFELALLSLLPQVPTADLLAAILMFRGIYYALPAVIALAACAAPRRATPVARAPVQPARRSMLWQAPRAEVGVIRQNGGTVIARQGAAMAVWPTAQSCVGLFDPVMGDMADLLPALQETAQRTNKQPCLYKVSAPAALIAHRAGWIVMRIAQEAVLAPSTFNLNTPARRGLRRKLRQAAKAGVELQDAGPLPLRDMAEVDRAWQKRRGGARAGSMGCFCPNYVAGQRVFLAYRGGHLLGYISFHVSAHEWCLDLMRSADDAPDGMMHALVYKALQSAAAAQVARVSLAALPDLVADEKGAFAPPWAALMARYNADGLRQFKASFAPHWQPLYAAAPNRLALGRSLIDIARAIHCPAPLSPAHNEDEYNEVAPIIAS